MVPGDKSNFCSCSTTTTSVITAGLRFWEVDVASRVSRVVGGGDYLDGWLSMAPRTSTCLGKTKFVSPSWAL